MNLIILLVGDNIILSYFFKVRNVINYDDKMLRFILDDVLCCNYNSICPSGKLRSVKTLRIHVVHLMRIFHDHCLSTLAAYHPPAVC